MATTRDQCVQPGGCPVAATRAMAAARQAGLPVRVRAMHGFVTRRGPGEAQPPAPGEELR